MSYFRIVMIECDGCGIHVGDDEPYWFFAVPSVRANLRERGWSFTRLYGDWCPDCTDNPARRTENQA